jgi:putative salt-induced outer membrane protein YdiY
MLKLRCFARPSFSFLFLLAAVLLGASRAAAQQPAAAPAKPAPDVLIFTDGEKLIGHLERVVGSSVVFKSDMAGEITVDWSKIQELHSSQKFAVIPKGMPLRRHVDQSKIPQGEISMTGQKLEITAAPGQTAQTMPVADASNIIDDATFQKSVVASPGLLQDWAGTITGGASLVEATQNSRAFNAAVSLVRADPGESWLEPRNRTIVDFSTAYGILTQPNTPSIKTDIYHADAERDEYFSSSLYAFGQAAFDHNFAQGLDLQQTYTGGLGWTVFKTPAAELDLKAGLSYINQQFAGAAPGQSLIGSVFGENYTRKFFHGIILTEGLTVTPAWNNLNAYSAAGDVALTMPLYKRFNFTTGVIDTFLNNPPAGFKKNSLQFTTGITYALR